MKSSIIAPVVAILAWAVPSDALEKRAKRVDLDAPKDEFIRGCSSVSSYYNICTGWVWIWEGFEPEAKLGVVYGPYGPCGQYCDIGSFLFESYVFTDGAAPPGYGYTGEIAIRNVDDNFCPQGPVIAAMPFLPTGDVFTETEWYAIHPSPYFALELTLGSAPGYPVGFATDRPSAGPTGPDACGTCYEATRETRSFFYGVTGAPECPGIPFQDGACNAELFWSAVGILCPPHDPLSVESASWGQIKGLYK